MKKASVIVVVSALALFAGASSWAQVIALPVKLKAIVAYPTISGNATVRLGVTEGNLIALGNHLVLVLDLTNHEMRLHQVDDGTNLVSTLMVSHRLAVLPDHTFGAGMQFSFKLPPQFGGVGVNGGVDITGKITPPSGVPKSINATVSGVLNDSVNGDTSNGDITIKGKLSRDGTPFDGGPFGL